MTLAERRAMFPAKTITWDAGHTVDGDNSAPLLPEHSDCNRSAGVVSRHIERSGKGRWW